MKNTVQQVVGLRASTKRSAVIADRKKNDNKKACRGKVKGW